MLCSTYYLTELKLEERGDGKVRQVEISKKKQSSSLDLLEFNKNKTRLSSTIYLNQNEKRGRNREAKLVEIHDRPIFRSVRRLAFGKP